jgi:hypothetical protein
MTSYHGVVMTTTTIIARYFHHLLSLSFSWVGYCTSTSLPLLPRFVFAVFVIIFAHHHGVGVHYDHKQSQQ